MSWTYDQLKFQMGHRVHHEPKKGPVGTWNVLKLKEKKKGISLFAGKQGNGRKTQSKILLIGLFIERAITIYLYII